MNLYRNWGRPIKSQRPCRRKYCLGKCAAFVDVVASNQCLGWHDQKLFRVTQCGGGFGRLKYHKHSAIYSDLHALCEGLRLPGLPHVTTPPCARVSPAEPQEHSTFWDKLTHQQYAWRNSVVKTFVDHRYNRLTHENKLMWYEYFTRFYRNGISSHPIL